MNSHVTHMASTAPLLQQMTLTAAKLLEMLTLGKYRADKVLMLGEIKYMLQHHITVPVQ